MLGELERRGELDQMDAVDGIIKNFDDQSDHARRAVRTAGKTSKTPLWKSSGSSRRAGSGLLTSSCLPR